MLTIKLLGGAKKSFSTDKLEIDNDSISVYKLIELLQERIPKNLPQLDVKNMLIAINGIDSSTLEGLATVLKDGDVVSIIPVIHGGNVKRIWFNMFKTRMELIGIKNNFDDPIKFLEDLRQKHMDLIIQGMHSIYVLNLEHAKKVITISLVAQKTGSMLSNKLETDILMRFACTRQISEAIQKVGIKRRENFILIAIGKKHSLDKLYSSLEHLLTSAVFPKNNSNFLKKEFGISAKQLQSVTSLTPLEDLLAEKSAVLFR
ncbi:MAG TPA: KEOPS complex subunit Cgi121 [Nitrosopumilaceae archaeon]|nr:KEOPS complex subunit Cgi121 [Nitrosopumilaceae archaeon]